MVLHNKGQFFSTMTNTRPIFLTKTISLNKKKVTFFHPIVCSISETFWVLTSHSVIKKLEFNNFRLNRFFFGIGKIGFLSNGRLVSENFERRRRRVLHLTTRLTSSPPPTPNPATCTRGPSSGRVWS